MTIGSALPIIEALDFMKKPDSSAGREFPIPKPLVFISALCAAKLLGIASNLCGHGIGVSSRTPASGSPGPAAAAALIAARSEAKFLMTRLMPTGGHSAGSTPQTWVTSTMRSSMTTPILPPL